MVKEGGFGQIGEGVNRVGRPKRGDSGLREIAQGLEADESVEPLGGTQAEEEAVEVDDVVEGVLIPAFA